MTAEKAVQLIKRQTLAPHSYLTYIMLYWLLLGNIALTYLVIRILGRT